MIPTTVLEQLDAAIRDARPEDGPALVVQLAARLAALGAGLTRAAVKGTGHATAPEQNVNVEEAARRLGVSRDWIYRTRLPFKVKIGRRVLCSLAAMERWNRQRVGQ